MTAGRVVLSTSDGRLSDSFLPERLSHSRLVQLIRDHAGGGGITLPPGGAPGQVLGVGPAGQLMWITPNWGGPAPSLTIVPDETDPDVLLVSGPETLIRPDPENPDYVFVAGILDPDDSDYLLIG